MLHVTQTAKHRFYVHDLLGDRIYGRYPSLSRAGRRVEQIEESQRPSTEETRAKRKATGKAKVKRRR